MPDLPQRAKPEVLEGTPLKGVDETRLVESVKTFWQANVDLLEAVPEVLQQLAEDAKSPDLAIRMEARRDFLKVAMKTQELVLFHQQQGTLSRTLDGVSASDLLLLKELVKLVKSK